MDISIIIPLYNEAESIAELCEWIKKVMLKHNFNYEIIFVDDGSNDNSWQVIENLKKENPETVRGISFLRNYGKSAALHTGFQASTGNVVITMDADLQDSPEEIPEMYDMIINQKYDLVSGWKKKRYDSKLMKNIPSKLFNFTVRLFTKIKLHDFNCGLKAYNKKVIKSIEIYGEMHRFIPVIAKRAGFKRIGEKVVIHQKRKFGVSKFGLERFVNGYLDLLTVLFITKFGKKPMHFFGVFGTLSFIAGACITIVLIILKLIAQYNNETFRQVTDQPLFYIAILAIILGAQLFLTGYIGELISRMSSDRNFYHIDKTL